MGFKRRVVDQSIEKRFIIGLIVSTQFLKEAQQLFKPELVTSAPVLTIAQWCFSYFDQYDEAPKEHIYDLFDSQECKLDEDLSKFISLILDQLNDEWEHAEKFNVEFLLDETEKYFKGKSLLALAANIKTAVQAENILEAESLQAQYNIIQRTRSNGIDPFTDESRIEEALSDADAEPLFRLPGALGSIMNPQFTRASFIAMQGPEKRGKSFWCDELALRAYRQKCNVAYFEAGDMTENQKLARIHSHIARKPLKRFYRADRPIKIPLLDCYLNQENSCKEDVRTSKVGCLDSNGALLEYAEAIKVGYTPCSKCNYMKGTVFYSYENIPALTIPEAKANGRKFFEKARGKRFKLSVHTNGSLNFKKIDAQLEIWKTLEGFIPDVIVVDYIGILGPEDSQIKEPRHQVNTTWKAGRGLSQKWNVCLITVDQTDAASYEQESIELKNFTEDKRKYGHVTAMYSLNQTAEERKNGIMRIGELLIREGETDMLRKVHVLECRSIGRINLGSFIGRG
jgi:hypothetical protein